MIRKLLKNIKELFEYVTPFCDHEYRQEELTCILGYFYPTRLKHKCVKCGEIKFFSNKYMSCCGREKLVKDKCKYCGI